MRARGLTPDGEESSGRSVAGRDWLCAGSAVVAALLLRAVPAARQSLWLDELHTLHHARASSLGALCESLRADNHPPLSFVLVRAARAAFGEGELALRLPSLVAGLLGVALALRVARALPGRGARPAAAWLAAASSLHLAASAEARMYALLALFVLLWIDGGVALCAGARRAAGCIGAATALGLLTHYHFLHALAVLAPALVACAPRARRRTLLLALGAGALVAAPWYAWAFREQLAHELMPGGTASSPRRLAEGLVHLLFHNASLAGAARPLFVAGGAAALLAAALGGARLVASRDSRPAGALLVAAAFALPAWAALVAAIAPRAGFHWAYLSASAVPFALLVGAEAAAQGRLARLRRASVGGVLVLALALAALNAAGPAREDYRGAVAFLLGEARPGDVVIAADWQPALFPQGIGWDYYAPRLADGRPLPQRLAVTPRFALERPEELAAAPRALVLGRSLKPDLALFAALRARFAEERVERFGESIFAHVFSAPR